MVVSISGTLLLGLSTLIFLAAAHTRLEGDHFTLELPQGPGFERISGELTTRRAIQAALSVELGREIQLDVSVAGQDEDRSRPVERLTPERVRAEQLQAQLNRRIHAAPAMAAAA